MQSTTDNSLLHILFKQDHVTYLVVLSATVDAQMISDLLDQCLTCSSSTHTHQ